MTEPLVARLRGVLFLSLIDDMQAIVDEAATELARLQEENEALRRERDEARANSVSRGKKLLRFRAKIIEISDNIEHEGDRAYFGSTNHADELREIFLWLDSFKWDRVMSESDDDDLLSSIENAVARANAAEAAREAAEAKAARLEEALTEIRDLKERLYDKFPTDWREQIAACSECQRYKDHPIQQGICDDHRKPLYARDRHNTHETHILGYRAHAIARAALEGK